MNRWWEQFLSIPWVDSICMCLNVYMPGPKYSHHRRKITRYAMLSMLMTYREISAKIADKYKDFQSLEDCGLLTAGERKKLETLQLTTDDQYSVYWAPMRWAQMVVRQVYNEGGIDSPYMMDRLIDQLQIYTGDKISK